jgi:hypothetical protein
MAGGWHGVSQGGVHGRGMRVQDDESARQRQSWSAGAVVGAAGLAVTLALVAAASHRALTASSAELAMREGVGASVQMGDRAGSEQVLTKLWDEDAVGKALDAEINAVKKSFMQQQVGDQTKFFKVKLHETGLQATNTSAAGNSTQNMTGNGTTPLFAFDGQWFADW